MGYREALEATGARVIDFQSFGSYQGDFFAIVEYNGTKAVVHGTYGSCSGCDSFEAEFGYSYEEDDTQYKKGLADFGFRYIENAMTIDEAIKYSEKEASWDMDAQKMIEWLKNLKKIEFADKFDRVIDS